MSESIILHSRVRHKLNVRKYYFVFTSEDKLNVRKYYFAFTSEDKLNV